MNGTRGSRRGLRGGGGRTRRPPLWVVVTLVVAVSVAGLSSYMLGVSHGRERGAADLAGLMGPCRALIVDQLGADFPDYPLIGRIAGLLEEANCSVTVIPSRDFTLDSLKLFGYYDVVIFRGHTGWANLYYPKSGRVKVIVGFFTGERYRNDVYVDLQRKGLVVEGIPLSRPVEGYNKTYIAVTQDYIREYVPVREGSVYILATCFAGSKELADVLLSKGASIVIGWDKNVTLSTADKILQSLVEAYAKHHSWVEAYRSLPEDMKVDRETGARLILYTRGEQG